MGSIFLPLPLSKSQQLMWLDENKKRKKDFMSLNTYGKGDMIFHNFASGQKSAQSVKSDTKLRSCMHNEMKQINMDCSASRSPKFGIL